LCEGAEITPDDLQLKGTHTIFSRPSFELLPLTEARKRFIKDYVRTALQHHDGNREATAAALGVSMRSLYRYLG
jgi:DNA-binding NtrC family response regulator